MKHIKVVYFYSFALMYLSCILSSCSLNPKTPTTATASTIKTLKSTATPSPSKTPAKIITQIEYVYVVALEAVYISDEPSPQSIKVGEALRGSVFIVYGETVVDKIKWYFVYGPEKGVGINFYPTRKDRIGWINEKFLSTVPPDNKPTATLPSFVPTPVAFSGTPLLTQVSPVEPTNLSPASNKTNTQLKLKDQIAIALKGLIEDPKYLPFRIFFTIGCVLIGLIIVFKISRIKDWATTILILITNTLKLFTKSLGSLAFLFAILICTIGLLGHIADWPHPWEESLPVLTWIQAIYIANSLLAIPVFGWDKLMGMAKQSSLGEQWRIAERTLHSIEFLGGWPGAWIAIVVFNHKREKTPFLIPSALITGFHLLLWFVLWLLKRLN